MMLREDEVNIDIIKQSRVLHFGTLSMTHDVVEKATVKAIETAKDSGLLLSLTPISVLRSGTAWTGQSKK